MKKAEDLIRDLRSVDDSPPPEEAMRYLAMVCELCNEAADELESRLKGNDDETEYNER